MQNRHVEEPKREVECFDSDEIKRCYHRDFGWIGDSGLYSGDMGGIPGGKEIL